MATILHELDTNNAFDNLFVVHHKKPYLGLASPWSVIKSMDLSFCAYGPQTRWLTHQHKPRLQIVMCSFYYWDKWLWYKATTWTRTPKQSFWRSREMKGSGAGHYRALMGTPSIMFSVEIEIGWNGAYINADNRKISMIKCKCMYFVMLYETTKTYKRGMIKNALIAKINKIPFEWNN